MTALRRTARLNGGPMQPLDLQTVCNQCNKSRAHGNHTKCSKLRQAEAAERRSGAHGVYIWAYKQITC
ncbi:hypothetical protein TU87_14370 [Pseudomonas weihenstephanensis]|nr:hypothetical protein TU87_14370 [Pseudomonas weihenstephanensis]